MAQEPETTTKRAELPMRLTRLRVKNFRSIADIDIPLSPLTVLVGPNGSGKSNVVDALRFVRDVFARGLDQAVMDREGMGVIQRWGTEGIEIGITIYLEGFTEYVPVGMDEDGEMEMSLDVTPPTVLDYQFSIVSSGETAFKIKREELAIYNKGNNQKPLLRIIRGENSIKGEKGISSRDLGRKLRIAEQPTELLLMTGLIDLVPSFYPTDDISDNDFGVYYDELDQYSYAVVQAVKRINEFLYYTLNPTDLRQPQLILKETPFDEKGRNLAAVLRRLSRVNKREWQELCLTLGSAIVGFKNIAVEPVGGYLAIKLFYQTDSMELRTSYIGQESDGTIRMLGLLAALLQEPSQPFISIEEPEANIHPGALAVLAGVIDEASLRSQILVTTHSPDMLDHLPVESFLVVEKVGDTTHVGPLDASQIASVRKRLFTPGELFRMEGLQRQAEPESAA